MIPSPIETTVIYYSSNREKPEFERRIIRSLLHASDGLPIISVSQKPMDLGKNICVGEVGISGFNALRQFQIGATEAKTRFVCAAESDMLYPKDYFKFIPPRDDTFYLASPYYVCIVNGWIRAMFYEKIPHEQVIVASRSLLLNRMEEVFRGREQWEGIRAKASILTGTKRELFPVSVPVVSFKTERNMHMKTRVNWKLRCHELQGIGTVKGLLRKYQP